jgi:hypothetical protein
MEVKLVNTGNEVLNFEDIEKESLSEAQAF